MADVGGAKWEHFSYERKERKENLSLAFLLRSQRGPIFGNRAKRPRGEIISGERTNERTRNERELERRRSWRPRPAPHISMSWPTGRPAGRAQ